MNKTAPYLHLKKAHSYPFHLLISLLPLLCYGIYKNGILPVWQKDGPFISILTPILFLTIGFLIGGLVDYLNCLRKKEKVKWKNTPIYGLLISMTMPIQMNVIIYGLLLFIILFFFCYLEEKISKIPISPLLLTEIAMLTLITSFKIPYENISEQSQMYVYTTLDLFFGRSIGGLASTSIFWMLLVFFYLWFDDYYKKELPIIIFITFAICALLSELFFPTGDVLKRLLNPVLFHASLFFAADMTSSPYTTYGIRLYGIGIGIVSFLTLRFFSFPMSPYYSIALFSFLVPLFDYYAYPLEKRIGSFVEYKNLKNKNPKKNIKQELNLPKKISKKEK